MYLHRCSVNCAHMWFYYDTINNIYKEEKLSASKVIIMKTHRDILKLTSCLPLAAD